MHGHHEKQLLLIGFPIKTLKTLKLATAQVLYHNAPAMPQRQTHQGQGRR